MHWDHLNIFYNELQKNSFKNPFASKNVFWEKKLAVLFQSNPFDF
jgi:hypothetical protein